MKQSISKTLLCGAALLAAGSVAHAQPGGGHHAHQSHHGGPGERGGHGMMMLRAADANGDNSVTRAEVEALQVEMFAWMDRNGDGYLDEADQSPVRRRLAAMDGPEDGEGRGWRGRHHRGDAPHMRADADDDGRISREEFLSADMPMFDTLDDDGNGTVTPEELDAAAARRQDRSHWWRD